MTELWTWLNQAYPIPLLVFFGVAAWCFFGGYVCGRLR